MCFPKVPEAEGEDKETKELRKQQLAAEKARVAEERKKQFGEENKVLSPNRGIRSLISGSASGFGSNTHPSRLN